MKQYIEKIIYIVPIQIVNYRIATSSEAVLIS